MWCSRLLPSSSLNHIILCVNTPRGCRQHAPPAVPQCHNIIWTFLHHLIELAITAGRNRRASNQKELLRSRPSPADICNYRWRKMGWDWTRSCGVSEGWSESLPDAGQWLKHLQLIRLLPLIRAISAGGECVVNSTCLTSFPKKEINDGSFSWDVLRCMRWLFFSSKQLAKQKMYRYKCRRIIPGRNEHLWWQ